MKKIFSFCLLALIMVACKKNKSDDGCSGEEFHYKFSNNKRVDTSHRIGGVMIATSESGTDIVFDYHYYSNACVGIADDGYSDWLLFQVPAGATNFEYNTPADLQLHNAFFTHSCFCPIIRSGNVTGTIKGTKMNNSKWSVEVNVTEPLSGARLSFNKQFILE